MPVLRALPLRRTGDNRLLALYHEGLQAHWGWRDRALGFGIALTGIAAWSPRERRFLSEEIRRRGLSMAERRGVNPLLNPAGLPPRANLLRNKALFARHADRHGLPAPESFNPAESALDDWLSARTSVIAKPGYSSKGEGIAVYFRAGDMWRGPAGLVGREALLKALRARLDRHGVVQELLRPHPAIADISPGALPTLRVVTCLDERGLPEVCVTILRLGAGNGLPVDNFNAGGIAVRIVAGRCAAGFRVAGNTMAMIDRHPTTSGRIHGRPLPDVDEALALALRAHRTIANGYAIVGWDIGLSDHGPLLIEGNWNPGTNIIQLVEGSGIDRTRLGALYRYHLERVPAERWRAARAIQ